MNRIFCYSVALAALTVACKPTETESHVNSELGRPSQGYQPPLPGCSPYILADYPLLPMPQRGITETYIPPGTAVESFAIDYEVWPLARVEFIRAEFETDELRTAVPIEIPGLCTRSFGAQILESGRPNEVERVRVSAGSDQDGMRLADVFFANGVRDLTVVISDQTDIAGEGWYLLFEPAWGNDRVAIQQADPSQRSWTMTGLPQGTGRVALIQTPAVGVQPPFEVLHAPAGFSADWPIFSTAWFGAVVSPTDTSAILTTIMAAGSAPQFTTVDEGAVYEWDPTQGTAILDARGTTNGEVQAPCGTSVRVSVPAFAALEVTHDTDTHMLGPGESLALSDMCTDGTWRFSFAAQSQNGRHVDIVIAEAE